MSEEYVIPERYRDWEVEVSTPISPAKSGSDFILTPRRISYVSISRAVSFWDVKDKACHHAEDKTGTGRNTGTRLEATKAVLTQEIYDSHKVQIAEVTDGKPFRELDPDRYPFPIMLENGDVAIGRLVVLALVDLDVPIFPWSDSPERPQRAT